MRALITGWFNYKNKGATVGDIAAARVIRNWLNEISIQADICENDWQSYSPETYQVVIFVCGPVGKTWPTADLANHFKNKKLIVVNATLIEDEVANCTVLPRDSTTVSNIDISLADEVSAKPLVGLVLIMDQKEYGHRDKQADVTKTIYDFVKTANISAIQINTELKGNVYSPFVVEKLISKMDVIITNRLHGLIYAVKYQVPLVLIDGIEGGGKVSKQAHVVDWPVITTSTISESSLRNMFEYCLTSEAKEKMKTCRTNSLQKVQEIKKQFYSIIKQSICP